MTKKNGTQTICLESLNPRKIPIFKPKPKQSTPYAYAVELPQKISSEEIKTILQKYQVSFDCDFVFYQKQNNKLFKTWFKNQKGIFSLCGSALLALCRDILPRNDINELDFITASNKIINAKKNMKTCEPEISITLNKNYTELNHSSWLTQSNVLVKKVTSTKKLMQISLQEIFDLPQKLSRPDLGAVCCFHQENEVVHIRYFTPWHGRDEDFVTLSIFEYLPLMLTKERIYRVIQNNSFTFHAYIDQKKVVLKEF